MTAPDLIVVLRRLINDGWRGLISEQCRDQAVDPSHPGLVTTYWFTRSNHSLTSPLCPGLSSVIREAEPRHNNFYILFWKIGHISQNMNGCNDTGASHYDLLVSVAEINFVIIIAIHQNESITC